MKRIYFFMMTFLTCNFLTAGMPAHELENVDEYREYLEERRDFYWDKRSSIIMDHELRWIAEYCEYMGRIDAYNDALFWLDMIGRPIPRD